MVVVLESVGLENTGHGMAAEGIPGSEGRPVVSRERNVKLFDSSFQYQTYNIHIYFTQKTNLMVPGIGVLYA